MPFRASRDLPAEAKLIWMEDWTVDRQGVGSWLTHAQLGVRLGMSENAVRIHRTHLGAYGFYERIKIPGKRSPGWRPTLPSGLPHLHTERPTPAAIEQVRSLLDAHLRSKPLPQTVSDGAGDHLKRSSRPFEAVRGTVSTVLSTAFDSQAVKQPSTALDSEGNRVSSIEQGQKAVENDGIQPVEGALRRGVLPQKPASDPNDESATHGNGQPQRRLIDERPRKEVEEEGWTKIAIAKREEKRRQAGLT
jgi:hypothetical protein